MKIASQHLNAVSIVDQIVKSKRLPFS